MLSSDEIKVLAKQQGFQDCGIARAENDELFSHALSAWLAESCHAEMRYMEQHQEMRADPRLLLPGCRAVVSVVLSYKPDKVMTGTHQIAQYAYGRDYHEVMREKLWALLATLRQRHEGLEGRPFVDTAPISDKLWALRAGLGWRGNNSLFIHPLYGSYVFLGELLLCEEADHYDTALAGDSLPKEYNVPTSQGGNDLLLRDNSFQSPCAHCTKCVDACPNNALSLQQLGTRQIYRLDARRCNSYNTIENRTSFLPSHIHLAGYAFGCDCCQTVCPVNQAAPAMLSVSADRISAMEQLANADEQTFKHFIKHTALSRIHFPQWRRNVQGVTSEK
jgi:epoxyqueuosine reductase